MVKPPSLRFGACPFDPDLGHHAPLVQWIRRRSTKPESVGSNPTRSANFGHVAQLDEPPASNWEDAGSTPAVAAKDAARPISPMKTHSSIGLAVPMPPTSSVKTHLSSGGMGFGPVVQRKRTPPSEGGSRWFESSRDLQLSSGRPTVESMR
jgi:hypothetical protein